MKKEPTKRQVMTDPILRKGHRHKQKTPEEVVCPSCKGHCYVSDEGISDCEECEGMGYILLDD